MADFVCDWRYAQNEAFLRTVKWLFGTLLHGFVTVILTVFLGLTVLWIIWGRVVAMEEIRYTIATIIAPVVIFGIVFVVNLVNVFRETNFEEIPDEFIRITPKGGWGVLGNNEALRLPNIELAPTSAPPQQRLTVTNRGAAGEFYARGKIIDTRNNSNSSPYDVRWAGHDRQETQIGSDDFANLLIATGQLWMEQGFGQIDIPQLGSDQPIWSARWNMPTDDLPKCDIEVRVFQKGVELPRVGKFTVRPRSFTGGIEMVPLDSPTSKNVQLPMMVLDYQGELLVGGKDRPLVFRNDGPGTVFDFEVLTVTVEGSSGETVVVTFGEKVSQIKEGDSVDVRPRIWVKRKEGKVEYGTSPMMHPFRIFLASKVPKRSEETHAVTLSSRYRNRDQKQIGSDYPIFYQQYPSRVRGGNGQPYEVNS